MSRNPPRRRPGLRQAVLLPPFAFLGLGASSAGLAGDLAAAAYLLAAETLAVFGVATGVALERHSRSRALALATARGRAERVTALLAHGPTYEITSRLARFLGQAMLVVGIAWLAFRDNLLQGAGQAGALPWGAFGLLLSVLFGITFLLNDVVVRLLVARRPNRTLLATLPWLEVARFALSPLRLPLVWLVKLVFRVDLGAEAPSAREEILETVEEGEREGSFTAEEAEMIGSIIGMERALVKDVLTPRSDMVMVQADASLEEALRVVVGEGYSRVPVYGRDRDDVIGILYGYDLLAHLHAPASTSGAGLLVRDLMRQPFFVPGNKSLGDLLKEMRSRKVHMAIIVDEFNGTAGLVTIEDLIEEIVGDIEDEYDTEEESVPAPRELGEGAFEVDARIPIEDVNERLGVALPIDEDFETLGGLVFHQLGKVPTVGDEIDLGLVRVRVVAADERTARTLHVARLAGVTPEV